MKEIFVEEFMTTAHSLVGRTCWGIAAGANTGSVVDLHFGKKFPLQVPIPNPALSEDLRRYYGELSVFVECAWRLDGEDRILCGWEEDFSDGGPLNKDLQLILNQTVESVNIQRPALDLTLYFSGALVLRVFCDQTEPSKENDNYVLFTPAYSYVVSTRSKLIREERTLK